MTSALPPKSVCPACGTEGSGRFCANCGATLTASTCAGCGTPLSPGAHFCHRCGTPVGAATPLSERKLVPLPRKTGLASSLPWAVAAIALLALLAMAAGHYFSSSPGSSVDASQNALPQAGLDNRGTAPPGSAGAPAGGGTDIFAMSPEERADRLFDRVMLLKSEGKTDSVLFFAPMAIESYQMLPSMSADQRYDMGRIGEVSGALPLAKAQADTILRNDPNHLLGLILAEHVALLSGDSSAAKKYEAKFLAVEKTEMARKLPEYDRHQNDIAAALADARRRRTGKA